MFSIPYSGGLLQIINMYCDNFRYVSSQNAIICLRGDALYSIGYQNQAITTVLQSVIINPTKIFYYQNYIYFSDLNLKGIYRFPESNPSQIETVLIISQANSSSCLYFTNFAFTVYNGIVYYSYPCVTTYIYQYSAVDNTGTSSILLDYSAFHHDYVEDMIAGDSSTATTISGAIPVSGTYTNPITNTNGGGTSGGNTGGNPGGNTVATEKSNGVAMIVSLFLIFCMLLF